MRAACFLFALGIGFAAVRLPGEHSGVVIFDRWGRCHLYSSLSVMEISETLKRLLRPHEGKAIRIDVKEVDSSFLSGDGFITALGVLGPAVESEHIPVAGLWLDAIPIQEMGGKELTILMVLRNEGQATRRIEMDRLAPTLFARLRGIRCSGEADGPSLMLATRSSISLMLKNTQKATCQESGLSAKMWTESGQGVLRTTSLAKWEKVEIPVRLSLSPGEYQFVAGYGVHTYRSIVSSQMISIDVAADGTIRTSLTSH